MNKSAWSKLHSILIPIFFIGAIWSCTSTADRIEPAHDSGSPDSEKLFLRIMQSPDADDYISELVKTHRIVFLPENHSTVGPILFLSENLEKFYNAGVRYLFLEGGMPAVPDSEEYSFYMFFPWNQVGWKYESVLLAQSVKRLNDVLPESERLKVIYAEADNTAVHPSDVDKMPEYINGRDIIAAECITSVMDSANPEDRAIVFYGGAHGSKNIYKGHRRENIPPFDWKPLGAYLSEYYGDEFFTFTNQHLSMFFNMNYFSETQWTELQGIEKVVGTDFFTEFLDYLPNPNFDAEILDCYMTYGTNYQYMPSDDNLRFIFRRLKDFESKPEEFAGSEGFLRFGNQGQYLMCIYYLKLFFNDDFQYNFWNPEIPLSTALERLENFAFKPGASPSEKVSFPIPSPERVREYHCLMMQSGIERYTVHGDKGVLEPVINNMEMAASLFPRDLWPLYWKAYAETVLEKYGEALADWSSLLSNPLSGSMENLPYILRMAAGCAEHLGLTEEADAYAERADGLWNEHDLNPEYADTGIINH